MTKVRTLCGVAAVCSLLGPLAGQSISIPGQVPPQDGIGVPEPFPGAYARLRQQFVFGASWLGGLQGRSLTGISFKRDGSWTKAMPGGRARVLVRVSSLAVLPTRVSTTFLANHGAVIEQAFVGTLVFPDSPALPHRDAADWSPSHSFRIDFARPVLYRGGALCVDIEGEPESGAVAEHWRIDYTQVASQGGVVHSGDGCGVVRSRMRTMAAADPRELQAGAAPRLVAFADPGSASAMVVAPSLLPQPLDLGFLGAPGCHLYVDPMVTLPCGFAAGAPARVETTLPFPSDAIFAGAQVFVQWVHFAPTGISASEALGLTLAGVLPGLDAAVLTSRRVDGQPRLPDVGYLSSSKLPAVQLHVQ
ncbi:MAG: hypothetical protein R3F56_08400 [Planctomycetota bacterium]